MIINKDTMNPVIHSLFFTALIAFIFFHKNSYGMKPLVTNGAKNYRALKDASLKNPTANTQKIAENIFLTTITVEISLLEVDILNFALHCPTELIDNEEKIRELTLEPKIRIFFTDSHLLNEENKLLHCIDTEGITHKINKQDLRLFINDAFNPSIYTNLIPKGLVEKDRNTIKTFIMYSKLLKKEKNITIPQPLIKNIFIPALCFNIRQHLSDDFKRIETISNPPDMNGIENEDCRKFVNIFLESTDITFASKAKYLMNSFNFTMVQKIIGHYFAKERSK